MTIIIEKSPLDNTYDLHIDTLVQPFIEHIEKVEGVEKVGDLCGIHKYQLEIKIGKAFDPETVLLNIQAEIIKHS